MTTALSPREKTQKAEALLTKPAFVNALKQVLPEHLTPERYVRMYLDATMSNGALLDCSPASVIKTVLKAAELGLEIGGALGHCYAIPYKSKCELVIGYKGLAELAYRSGRVRSVMADVVTEPEYKRGTFRIRKSPPEVFHDFDPTIGVINEPDLFLAYARIELMTGGVVVKVLNREQVHARRPGHWDRKSDSPWKVHPASMWRKTALRAALGGGEVPLSPKLEHALALPDRSIEVLPPFEPVDDVALLAEMEVGDE